MRLHPWHVGLSPNIRRLVSGVAWALTASVGAQGAAFLANVLFARKLGPGDYGRYTAVQLTIITLAGVFQVAMGGTAAKYVAEYRSTDSIMTALVIRTCRRITLVMAIVGAITLAALSPWIAARLLGEPSLQGCLVIAAVALAFTTYGYFQSGVLAGFEAFSSLAAVNSQFAIILIGAAYVGSTLAGVRGAVAALAVASFAWCALSGNRLGKLPGVRVLPSVPFQLARVKHVLSNFALPATLCGLFSLPAMWAGTTVLLRNDNGFVDMGVYGAANTLRQATLFMPQLIGYVGLAILNNTKGLKNDAGYRSVFKSNLQCVVGTASLAVLGVYLLSPWIPTVMGARFAAARPVLLILLVSVLVESLTVSLHQYIQSHEELWRALWWVNIPREGSFVILAYLLSASHRAEGVAIAYTISRLIGLLGTQLVCRQIASCHRTSGFGLLQPVSVADSCHQ